MSIRKILLPLASTRAGAAALGTALVLAASWRAHVDVLHVRLDSRDVSPLAGDGLSGAMIEDIMTATENEGSERSRSVRALFDVCVAEHGVAVGPAQPGAAAASASFTTLVGRADEMIAQRSRLADLVVVPHGEAGQDLAASEALHAVLFDSRRPVVIAPLAAPASVGRRCCLAWNGTAEASRMVAAMLPLLQRAEAVQVIHSDEYSRPGPPVAELLRYLELHGIHAGTTVFPLVERSVGAGLLTAARAFHADLLGMGAYSKSRLLQMIAGGNTRYVLEHADLPLLLSR